jgi:RHS repeat-associated protein
MRLGNGVETEYRYDEKRRWLSGIGTKSGNEVLQGISYRFDLVGNVGGYKNEAGQYKTEQEYRYDGLYQLTGVEGVTESRKYGQLDYTARYSQEYMFDQAGLGNMERKVSGTANSDGRIHGDALDYELEYEYEGGYAHRVKRIGKNYYSYDLNGNVIVEEEGIPGVAGTAGVYEITGYENGTKSVGYGWALGRENPDAGAALRYRREYEWDERNQLRQSRDNRYNVQYTYGHEGERSGKYGTGAGGEESETLYYNKMWTWKYDGLLSDRTGRNSKHIYLGETRVVTKTGYGDGSFTDEERQKQYYYHSDHLGSAQLITNYRGEEYERIEYTPYGEVWVEKAVSGIPIDIPYRFTGKERDSETGLYYYGARYLDPKTGRWLSTDPAVGDYIPGAPIDDDAKKRNGNLPGMGGVFNYVNLHLYHYAGNNPVKYTDPDGNEPINATLVNAINLDFGMDYIDLAKANISEGEYGTAAVMVTDAIFEAAYDYLGAFKGASAIGKALAFVGIGTNAIIVLGKFKSGAFGGYVKMAKKINASYFQLPSKLYDILDKKGIAERINKAWLQIVSGSGARILLNTDPQFATGPYGKEIEVVSKNYEFVEIIIEGVKCWEAIEK